MAEEFERYQKPIPIGYNIYLEGEDKYYQIVNREQFNITKKYAELAKNGSLSKTEETVIEPADNVIYQFWTGIKHNVILSLWQPSSTKSLGTDEDPDGFITPEISPYNIPNRDYTLFMPPEESLHLDMKNQSQVSLAPELRYTGYKYKVEELGGKPDTFLTVPTESFGG